jgi:hypothetical protein
MKVDSHSVGGAFAVFATRSFLFVKTPLLALNSRSKCFVMLGTIGGECVQRNRGPQQAASALHEIAPQNENKASAPSLEHSMSKKKGGANLPIPAPAPLPPAAEPASLEPVDAHTAHIQQLLRDGAALNKDAIRRACREDGVPHALRGVVWQVLLDVFGRDDDTLFDANVTLDLKDQAVIHVDLERTRTDEPTFAHKAARDEAAALLTLYLAPVAFAGGPSSADAARQVLQAPQRAVQPRPERNRRALLLYRRGT